MTARPGLVALATVTLSLALGAAPAAAAEPLRGQWHLDPPQAPGQTPDSSGNALNGIVQGFGVNSFSPGRFGGAFQFISTDSGSGKVIVPASPLLEPRAVTALAWVRAPVNPGPLRVIVAKGGTACDAASFSLYNGVPSAQGPQFYICNGSQAYFTPSAGTGVWDGQWHLVVGTFDGARVRLYVDGRQVGSGTAAPTSIQYALPERRFTIGDYINTCPNPGVLNGDIDEVRVYSRALSPTEIARLAAAPGPNPPPLVPDGGGGAGGGGGGTPAPPLPVPRVIDAKSKTLKRATWLSAGTSSVAPGLRINKYEWDFNNDGIFEGACGLGSTSVSHAFQRPGKHVVGLKMTDNLDRVVATKKLIRVPVVEVNKFERMASVFTCEDPVGPNQPNREDCVKTFGFSIVSVNGRGARSQCFEVASRPRSSGSRQSFYRARIDGPVALNGLPISLPSGRTSEFDSGESRISMGRVPLLITLPGGQVRAGVDLDTVIRPDGSRRFRLPPLQGSGGATSPA